MSHIRKKNILMPDVILALKSFFIVINEVTNITVIRKRAALYACIEKKIGYQAQINTRLTSDKTSPFVLEPEEHLHLLEKANPAAAPSAKNHITHIITKKVTDGANRGKRSIS